MRDIVTKGDKKWMMDSEKETVTPWGYFNMYPMGVPWRCFCPLGRTGTQYPLLMVTKRGIEVKNFRRGSLDGALKSWPYVKLSNQTDFVLPFSMAQTFSAAPPPFHRGKTSHAPLFPVISDQWLVVVVWDD